VAESARNPVKHARRVRTRNGRAALSPRHRALPKNPSHYHPFPLFPLPREREEGEGSWGEGPNRTFGPEPNRGEELDQRKRQRNMGEAKLNNQVALVTGSTQGIGAGIAKKFAAQGARIVIHGLPVGAGAEVAAAVRDAGSEALVVCGDLREETFCRNLVRQTIERFGHLDILVNNAASTARSDIEDESLQLWDDVLAINLRAPFILCREAVRNMKERRSGCIINIGSVNAYVGMRNLLAYSVSKGGLMTFTRNLAFYLTKHRIRVNQINPGWVLTEGERHVQSVIEGKGEDWLAQAVQGRPFGRMLYPEDIAQAALFLATAELITGAVLDYEQVPVGAPRET
jgi:NAD(P)-dependent dehydrogenase (short-subunit alcohol dehydrogenase family)